MNRRELLAALGAATVVPAALLAPPDHDVLVLPTEIASLAEAEALFGEPVLATGAWLDRLAGLYSVFRLPIDGEFESDESLRARSLAVIGALSPGALVWDEDRYL